MKLIIFISILIVFGCQKETKSTKFSKTENIQLFNKYFHLDSSESHLTSYNSEINLIKLLNKQNNFIDTSKCDLEISLISNKLMGEVYYYRFRFYNDTIWTGEVYLFDDMMYQIKSI